MTSQTPSVKPHVHCMKCVRTDCTIPADGERSCDIMYCKYGCGQQYHECKDEEHKKFCETMVVPCINKIHGCPKELPRHKLTTHLPVCPANVVLSTDGRDLRRDEYYWYHKNIFEDFNGDDLSGIYQHCPLAQYGCDFKYSRIYPKNAPNAEFVQSNLFGFVGMVSDGSSQVSGQDSSKEISSEQTSIPNSPQEMAADLGKLHLGETAVKKLAPQRSFSVGGQEFSLEMLPSEVLYQIVRHLDSFSVCNVALTCHTLRNICASLLHDKGLEVSKWKSGLPKKVWKFSGCIGPLKDWVYNGNRSLLRHLQECPYNKGDNITKHTKPFCLGPVPETDLEGMKNKLVDTWTHHWPPGFTGIY